MGTVPHRLAESLGRLGLCFHASGALTHSLFALRWPLGRAPCIQELLLERIQETNMRFALRRQTGFSHQVKKATLSFCRVIGIFLPVLMLALRQHHSAVEKPRRLCCTLAYWADVG